MQPQKSTALTLQVDLVESFLLRCGAKPGILSQNHRCTTREMWRVVPRRDASMAMVDELQMAPLVDKNGKEWLCRWWKS